MPKGIYERTEYHKQSISNSMLGVKKSTKHRENISKARKEILSNPENHPNYHKRGEETIAWNKNSNHRTYWKVKARREMEIKINRKLKPKESVHHLDHDKTNNHPDNLHLFDNSSKHMKYHWMLQKLVEEELEV